LYIDYDTWSPKTNGKSDKTGELFVHRLWYLITQNKW
jgi:hypothetical protein